MFFKISVLKIIAISQQNTCVEVFFNKIAGLQACNFIKKRLQHRCFPVKFTKFLRTPFFTEHLQWLFLPFLQMGFNCPKATEQLKGKSLLFTTKSLSRKQVQLFQIYFGYLIYPKAFWKLFL